MAEYIANLEETKQIAIDLADSANIGDCFSLSGDLGAGKTEFARAFIQSICGESEVVSSPTFNIVQIYNDKIAHFDLYRIEAEEELEEIGLEEMLLNHISLIEWPDIAGSYLPKKVCQISIEILEDNNRKISIQDCR